MATRVVLDGKGGFKTIGSSMSVDNAEVESAPVSVEVVPESSFGNKLSNALAAHAKAVEERTVNGIKTTSTNPRILSGVPSTSTSNSTFLDLEAGLKKRAKKDKAAAKEAPAKRGRPRSPLDRKRYDALARKKSNTVRILDVMFDEDDYMIETTEIIDANGVRVAHSVLLDDTIHYLWD